MLLVAASPTDVACKKRVSILAKAQFCAIAVPPLASVGRELRLPLAVLARGGWGVPPWTPPP